MNFYDEVRDIGAIDWNSPLSQYLKAALIPNQGSGQVVSEIVSGEDLTFTQPLVWNTDGSVTKNSYVDEPLTLTNSPSVDTLNEDVIGVIHTNVLASNSANQESVIHWVGNAGFNFSIYSFTWGNPYRVSVNESWNNTSIDIPNTETTGEKVLVTHWVNSTNTLNVYVNGQLHSTATGTFNGSSVFNALTLGVGQQNEKFYSSQVLAKTGAFTQSEIDEIVNNPYGIFQTAQDVQDEYGLVFDATQGLNFTGLSGDLAIEIELAQDLPVYTTGRYLYDGRLTDGTGWLYQDTGVSVSSSSVSNPKINGQASTLLDLFNSGVKGDVLSFDATAQGSSIRLFSRYTDTESYIGAFIASITITDTNGQHYWDFNQTTGDTVTDKVNGSVATLVNFPVDSGYVEENGQIVGYQLGDTTQYISNVPSFAKTPFGLKCRLSVADASLTPMFFGSSTANFNAVLFSVNPDLTIRILTLDGTSSIASSAATVTLNTPFDLEVYLDVDAQTYKMIINGVTETGNLPFDFLAWEDIAEWRIGGWSRTGNINEGSGVFTFYDNFQVVTVDVNFDNPVVINNYDFTTGDNDQIIETVNNQHGTIVNASTTKWQRIIEKQVYTVGVGKDYSTVYPFVTANYLNSGEQVAVIYGEVNVGGDCTQYMDAPTEFADGLTLLAEIPFDGDTTGKSTVVGGADVNRMRWGVDGSVLRIDGIVFKADAANSNSPLQFNAFRQGWECYIDNFAFIGLGGASADRHGINFLSATGLAKYVLKNGYIQGWAGNGIDANNANVEAIATNVVSKDNNTTGSGFRGNFAGANLTSINCVGGGGASKDFLAVTQGSNNVSSDATATSDNSQINVDFTGAFVDEVNGDYRINQAWADTNLVGKGWNGSDIAGWSYYTAAGGLTVLSSLDVRNMTLGAVLSSVDIRQQILSALASITSSLDIRNSLYNAVVSSKDIRQQIYNTAISSVDLRHGIYSFVQQDLDTRSSVFAPVASSVELQQKILSAIFNNLDIRQSILGSTVSQSVDIRQAILGATVSQSAEIITGILGAVSQNVEVVGQVLTSVNASKDVQQQIYGAIASGVDVRQQIYTALSSDLDVRQQVYTFTTNDLDVRMNSVIAIQQNLDIRHFMDGLSLAQDLPFSFTVSVFSNEIETDEPQCSFDVICDKFTL